MAGHSKWANIRHKKEKEDAKRGKVFTKLVKEITICAKASGGDIDSNPRLRQLVEKAKAANMPQDNIVRAIKKGTGELPGVSYEAITYEGYGPGGIAVIFDVLTDNKNRSVADFRHIFSRHSGNLAETGAVNWMFERLGVIRCITKASQDDLLETLIDYDIKDISVHDTTTTISTDPHALMAVKDAVEKIANTTVEHAELEWVATNLHEITDEETEKKAMDFLEILEDNDDVQNVYTNLG